MASRCLAVTGCEGRGGEGAAASPQGLEQGPWIARAEAGLSD